MECVVLPLQCYGCGCGGCTTSSCVVVNRSQTALMAVLVTTNGEPRNTWSHTCTLPCPGGIVGPGICHVKPIAWIGIQRALCHAVAEHPPRSINSLRERHRAARKGKVCPTPETRRGGSITAETLGDCCALPQSNSQDQGHQAPSYPTV